jgi:predicted DNA-binding transcriptional regulator AlpA
MTTATQPEAAYLSQREAAAYLGMSAKTFRRHVRVSAVPVTVPKPGQKPLLRYRRADLDAYVSACATYKMRSA